MLRGSRFVLPPVTTVALVLSSIRLDILLACDVPQQAAYEQPRPART